MRDLLLVYGTLFTSLLALRYTPGNTTTPIGKCPNCTAPWQCVVAVIPTCIAHSPSTCATGACSTTETSTKVLTTTSTDVAISTNIITQTTTQPVAHTNTVHTTLTSTKTATDTTTATETKTETHTTTDTSTTTVNSTHTTTSTSTVTTTNHLVIPIVIPTDKTLYTTETLTSTNIGIVNKTLLTTATEIATSTSTHTTTETTTKTQTETETLKTTATHLTTDTISATSTAVQTETKTDSITDTKTKTTTETETHSKTLMETQTSTEIATSVVTCTATCPITTIARTTPTTAPPTRAPTPVIKTCSVDSHKIGCYKDDMINPRPLQELLFTDRDKESKLYSGISIDWGNWDMYIADIVCRCAKTAHGKEYNTFGIEYFGECWSGFNATNTYSRAGPSDLCITTEYGTCDPKSKKYCVGNATTVFVYGITGDEATVPCAVPFENAGCYKDNNSGSRPLPELLFTDVDTNAEEYSGHSVLWGQLDRYLSGVVCRCAKKAAEMGYEYFGIQNFGQCYSGKSASQTYKNDEASDQCVHEDYEPCSPIAVEETCVGKDKANYVYRIIETPSLDKESNHDHRKMIRGRRKNGQ